MNWKLGCALVLALMPSLAAAQDVTAMSKNVTKLISARLVDPDSLVLRNTRVVSATSPNGASVNLLCGEYNAKNRFGGYVGFTSFIFEQKEMQGAITVGREIEFLSYDGQNDFNREIYKRPNFDDAKIQAVGERLQSYVKAYWDAC